MGQESQELSEEKRRKPLTGCLPYASLHADRRGAVAAKGECQRRSESLEVEHKEKRKEKRCRNDRTRPLSPFIDKISEKQSQTNPLDSWVGREPQLS